MHPDAPIRRITTWLAILGYALVASGLPLPLGGVAPDAPVAVSAKRLSAKDRSRPFPCMDKPCGCDTADRCFANCCCHTPLETLAWARAHRVEPALLVALEYRANGDSRSSVTTRVSAPRPESSCCSTARPTAAQSCCVTTPSGRDGEAAALESRSEPEPRRDRQALVAPHQAAADATVADAPGPPATDESSPRPQARGLILRAVLACGGILAEWFMAGAALPPPQVEGSLAMPPVDKTIVADAIGAGLRAAPDAPPPRTA